MIKCRLLRAFPFLCLICSTLVSKNCYFEINTDKNLSILNKKQYNCKHIFIKFGLGKFILKRPLLFEFKHPSSLVVMGAGIGNTKVLIDNNISAIHIYSDQRNNEVEIRDMSLYAIRSNIKNAIFFSQPRGGNQHHRNLVLRDLEIAGYKNSEHYFFKNAISLIGIWRPLINNVFITGYFGPKANPKRIRMQSCFSFRDVYSPTLTDSRCWSSIYGVSIYSRSNPGPEGVMIQRSKFVNVFVGINIDLVSQEPEGFIIDNHINAIRAGIKITNKKFILIKNNLIYRNKNSSKNFNYIVFNNVKNSMIVNNIFHYPSKKSSEKIKFFKLIHSHHNMYLYNIFTARNCSSNTRYVHTNSSISAYSCP